MSNRAEDNVVVKNIYYMMAYAFQTLEIKDYKRLETEPFENLADLFAAILTIGIASQRRRGFEHGYNAELDELMGVRGRINMQETARLRSQKRQEISCEYDEYTVDTYKNRILRTCAELLVRSKKVPKERRLALKRALIPLRSDVGEVDPIRIEWARLRYHRNNSSYKLLMNVCYMVVQGYILSTDKGETSLADIIDKQKLHRLFQAFVLEYFRERGSELGVRASAKEISRKASAGAPPFLPNLYTDIYLENENQVLIIDAKCYGKILEMNHGKRMMRPSHLNQIQSYVVHDAHESSNEVNGMLLYALTKSEDARHESWNEIGHTWHCWTLDLNLPFKDIAGQLDAIAELVASKSA